MNTPPRRLSFAVGTTLLTASLATGASGCAKKTVNEGPEPPHVNEGPEPQEPVETVNVAPTPEPTADEAAEDDATPEQPEAAEDE